MPRPPGHVYNKLTKFQRKELELIILAKMEAKEKRGAYNFELYDHTDLRYLKKEAAQYMIQRGIGSHAAVELAFEGTKPYSS